MRRIRRTIHEEVTPNLTPLIDVVFVILILFIVIAPLLESDRIELASGTSNAKVHGQEQPLSIHVYADDTISVNKRLVSLLELEKILLAAHKRYPNARPQLFQDRRATFGTYQSVKGAIEKAGFSEMDVLLKPQ